LTSEEEVIKEFIVTNYVIPGVLFTNEDFRDMVIGTVLEGHSGIETCVPFFNASVGFFAQFKLRNEFSVRSIHLKNRSPPCP
jgi:hypothetical protein